MGIKIIDPSTDPAWDAFVSSHRDGSIYHSSRWNEVLRQTYGYMPRYFILEDPFHTVRAGVPLMVVGTRIGHRKLVGLPFTPYCNPLAKNHDDLIRLLKSVLEYKKKIKASSLEIRTKGPNHDYTDLSITRDQYFMTHILRLDSDLQKIKSFFHKSCIQRPLRKAEKNELILHVSTDRRDLKDFYKLQLRTRKRHGVPPQPYRYFLNMWDELHSPGFMDLLLATYKGAAIAAIIILKFKDTAIYQNGASDERFLGLHPNHFLLWKAIKHVHGDGYSYFDFGRSSLDDDGLVQFKDRWGTKRCELVYYFHPKASGATSTRQNNWRYKFSINFFRLLPISLSRIIGEFGYRYLG
ncbi:MAG: lipid II:glycine glycyltransferase FemX [Candidatus Hodarchaeota archaeon]